MLHALALDRPELRAWALYDWANSGMVTVIIATVFPVYFYRVAGADLAHGAATQWYAIATTLGLALMALLAPIFVPMLMLIGYSPEVIATAYRIGDSTTNIITPMMSYFGLILAWATRYNRNVGIGTMIAMMLPYSIFFTIGWTVLFFVWVFGLGLPVGPGSPTFYTPGG